MSAKVTEGAHRDAKGLDQRPLADVATVLAQGQIEAATAVLGAAPAIAGAASRIAQTLRNGGKLHYIAAGSSGLMAASDAQELGGTFSIPAEQLAIHMAGGLPNGVDMPGETEDDVQGLDTALAGLTGADCVIAVSASGSTPYTLAGAKIANAKGAAVIAIANNPDTPLLQLADFPILLPTPPEVLAGSTRMGAGTAQKIALNMLSTLMAVELGHIHDGMMVNLRADNIKLRGRARGIIQEIAGVSAERADAALKATDGAVKPAVLVAALNLSVEAARQRLGQAGGVLRVALERHD